MQACQSATIHGQPLVKCAYIYTCMYVCIYVCVWANCPNVTDKHIIRNLSPLLVIVVRTLTAGN